MNAIGVDVSKAKLHCALLVESSGKFKSKTVANTPEGVRDLVHWSERQGVKAADLHAVMEATGVYHETAALHLFELGVTVSIINPAQVRDFARGLAVRTKNDGVDSGVLARYGALLKPQPWQPPPPEVRYLQGLLARRDAVAQDLQREKNRQEKAEFAQQSAQVLASIDSSIAFLQAELARLEKTISDHIDRHPGLKDKFQLLTTIPAVGERVGQAMLAVMTSKTFLGADQLTAFLGLIPVERQSGTTVYARPRLSKAGPPRLRAVLYMAAIVATRYNPHVKALYLRLLQRGKAKKAALGAAMRKLVQLCYGVLNSGRPYQAPLSSPMPR